MIWVDYIFYVEKYHGTLIDDEESLKLPVLKANTYLNQVLRGSLREKRWNRSSSVCAKLPN